MCESAGAAYTVSPIACLLLSVPVHRFTLGRVCRADSAVKFT